MGKKEVLESQIKQYLDSKMGKYGCGFLVTAMLNNRNKQPDYVSIETGFDDISGALVKSTIAGQECDYLDDGIVSVYFTAAIVDSGNNEYEIIFMNTDLKCLDIEKILQIPGVAYADSYDGATVENYDEFEKIFRGHLSDELVDSVLNRDYSSYELANEMFKLVEVDRSVGFNADYNKLEPIIVKVED